MKTPKLPRNAISRVLFGSALALAFGLSATYAQPAPSPATPMPPDYNQLKASVDTLKQTVDAQAMRIIELEKAARSAVPPGSTAAAGASQSQKTIDTVAAGGTVGTASPVENRNTMADQQDAASRPGKYVLDPKYRGFFPIPNSPVLIKINAKPHLDIIGDDKAPGARHRFVPALFPLEGSPGFVDEMHSTVSANATQLKIDVRAPDLDGNIRFFYQNDFTGDDQKDMRYRLQHLYGTLYGFKGGFTYGAFEDPDSWPDTVDYEGPNAVLFVRRPVAQYTFQFGGAFNATAGLEKPDFFVDLASGPTPGGVQFAKYPDLAGNVRWEPGKLGHIQVSGILREIGVKKANGATQTEPAYGGNVSAVFNVGNALTLMALGVAGDGIGGLGNDAGFFNTDAAFDSAGNLKVMPYWSFSGAATYRFGNGMRSTLTYGYVNLDNASGQSPTFYHETTYASLNIIFQVRKQLQWGAEVLYGNLKARNGAESGDRYRFQVGMVYSLFD